MGRSWQLATMAVVVLSAGCLDQFRRDGKKDQASSLWGGSAPVDAPPADTETASRVDALGRQILAANPSITFRPVFLGIGTVKETVFHQGTETLCISSGLVKRCKSEGELAAILCLELGKMVSEKEALAIKDRLHDEERTPLLPPLSRDVMGGSTTPDQTELAERSKLEAMNPRRRGTGSLPPVDPHVLASGYLKKAGFKPEELTKVGGLLKAAELNPQFEQQLGKTNAAGLAIPERKPVVGGSSRQ